VSVHPITRSATHRKRPPRWGVVSCPDGRRYVDLDVIRAAMTRLIVAGELPGHPVASLASKTGLNRSTVSRMLNGRIVSVGTLLAALAALGLTFADVGSGVTVPDERASGT
jgi:hypothetical protein